MLGSGGVVV